MRTNALPLTAALLLLALPLAGCSDSTTPVTTDGSISDSLGGETQPGTDAKTEATKPAGDGQTASDQNTPSPDTTVAIDDRWKAVTGVTKEDLLAVHGAAAGEVWAVGDKVILRYDGSKWSSTASLVAEPKGVWALASDDVWVVGANGAQHYDGKDWTLSEDVKTEWLSCVYGAGKNDIWALGMLDKVFHYTGSWSSSTEPTHTWTAIWGSGTKDVWTTSWGGWILHYNGTAWADSPSGTKESLYAMWGFSATDIWAVGDNDTILHYDGKSWNKLPTGLSASAAWSGVWGTSSKDLWVVGGEKTASGSYSGSMIGHYDGSKWTISNVNGSAYLQSVWGSSSSDVWAVGMGGTLYHFTAKP